MSDILIFYATFIRLFLSQPRTVSRQTPKICLSVHSGYARQSFEETHAGLYTLLTSDKNFANHVERKYRLKQYEQEGEFFMTANERWFHLIGFIDALIWFYRGNLFKDPDTLQQELADAYCSDDEPPDEENIADYKATLEGMVRETAQVTNHQFDWWFDFSPPKGYITARPTERCRKHFYWSAIKRYYRNLLFSILLPALLYTSVQSQYLHYIFHQ